MDLNHESNDQENDSQRNSNDGDDFNESGNFLEKLSEKKNKIK